MNKKKRIKSSKKSSLLIKITAGISAGFINGFFGSGGGIIEVEAMEKMGLPSKQSHATSLLAILPLSIISGIVYLSSGHLSFDANTIYLMIGAAIGGLFGALMLGKLHTKWIDIIFTLLILISGIRMVA